MFFVSFSLRDELPPSLGSGVSTSRDMKKSQVNRCLTVSKNAIWQMGCATMYIDCQCLCEHLGNRIYRTLIAKEFVL